MQHMRTHDDWPDDEAAAQLLADVEKKSGKKAANTGLPSEKDFGPFGPMVPFPWQMQPAAFLKWAQQQGNPFVPFVPPTLPLPTDPSTKDVLAESMDIDAELVLQDSVAMVNGNSTVQGDAEEHATQSGEVTAEQPPTSPAVQSPGDSPAIAPDLMMLPASTSQDLPPTSKKKKGSKGKTKAAKGMPKPPVVVAPPAPTPAQAQAPVPMEPLEAEPDVSMEFMPNMINPMMGGMSPWPMPPGMQFPFMMPPHMPHVPPMPPGMPFPPPAIAIPIPAGAPLPHPTQLPPNAQLIPDSKGGHTVIIPPPPSPWGMPFLPGMIPSMPMFPGGPAPPSIDLGHATNADKAAPI